MCELAFHPRLRQSLRVHHVVCVALFVLMHFCFAKHKALVVLQMGVFNVMNALTEQTVFVFMLLHRVCPPVLRRWPVLGFVLTMCYAGTRVLFGSLALRAWYGFATDAALRSARTELYGSIVLVTYPLLTLIQMATQWECFRVQLGLARRYANGDVETDSECESHYRSRFLRSDSEFEYKEHKRFMRSDSSSSSTSTCSSTSISSCEDEFLPGYLIHQLHRRRSSV
ncbi:hypothetical protein ATCC90586_000412 [Pythium insidiosum]|nr:hypothetical protein ATCC90586_000412 [Pythium insidiosum]